MGSISFKLKNVKCSGCVNNIKAEFMKLPGITSLNISLEKSEINLEYQPDQISPVQMREILKNIGYPVVD